MSTFVSHPTKTISLRITTDSNDFLEEMARRTGRSKSNYIKWLIQQEKNRVGWPSKQELEEMRQIGKQGSKKFGLDPESMTDENTDDFFKSL